MGYRRYTVFSRFTFFKMARDFVVKPRSKDPPDP